MAFIDFLDAAPQALPIAHSALFALNHTTVAGDAPKAVAASKPEQVPAESVLSELELRVIELARDDGLPSLNPSRKRGWLARLVLGPVPPSPILANEGLEAVRRLAVHAWYKGYTLPASAMREAAGAGLSESKIGAVIDTIARSRAPVRRLTA